ALFWKGSHPRAAFWAMLAGGSTTILLIVTKFDLPWGLDPNVGGITISAICFVALNYLLPKK
ncbi:MAG: hypothetical protein KDC44_07045, partial [Phaeodactylibacter sp.]|nr:hypothetical protein [Phaeodactylibacter sp.]